MKLQSIEKSININAPKERVWIVLLDDKYTKIWYQAFSKGAHADTDWREGSTAIFSDDSGFGLISKVIENKPYERITLEHRGVMNNGREEFEGDLARSVKGALEIYQLSEIKGVTSLSIRSDMDETYYESMSKAWEEALAKVKELSENA